MSTWVLVANRVGARLFERRGQELNLLRSIDHPAGRAEDHDLETGPQRSFDSHAQGRHAADRGGSHHERAALSFAHHLAKLVEEGRTTKGLKSIVLVAEPHFLGLLRAELGNGAGTLVITNVPRDLHAVSSPDVLGHLEGVLPDARG